MSFLIQYRTRRVPENEHGGQQRAASRSGNGACTCTGMGWCDVFPDDARTRRRGYLISRTTRHSWSVEVRPALQARNTSRIAPQNSSITSSCTMLTLIQPGKRNPVMVRIMTPRAMSLR